MVGGKQIAPFGQAGGKLLITQLPGQRFQALPWLTVNRHALLGKRNIQFAADPGTVTGPLIRFGIEPVMHMYGMESKSGMFTHKTRQQHQQDVRIHTTTISQQDRCWRTAF